MKCAQNNSYAGRRENIVYRLTKFCPSFKAQKHLATAARNHAHDSPLKLITVLMQLGLLKEFEKEVCTWWQVMQLFLHADGVLDDDER